MHAFLHCLSSQLNYMIAKSGAIGGKSTCFCLLNQISVDIFDLKNNGPFIFIKLFITDNSTRLILMSIII